MPEHKGSFEEDVENRKLFVDEGQKFLKELERGLAQLRGHPESTDLLSEMRRLAHTLKGNALMMEGDRTCAEIKQLAEKMQASIEELRDGKKKISDEIIDALLEDLGGLRVLVGNVETRTDTD